jgi:DNA-binding FrmR family transcriptional regulator
MLDGIAAFAQHHLAEHRLNQQRLALMREAIEQVVDASEPRIRLVGNYAEKLLDAVETASRHSEDLLRRLPSALTLSRRAWMADPRVNAFFATADDLRSTLSLDPCIQAFFKDGNSSECFALMLMVKRETATFGMALQGDMLVREVPQTLVSFSHHRLFFPIANETGLRRELRQRTLIFLATRALERINELRTRRSDLEERRRQLQAQLRAVRGHARGLHPMLSTGADADEIRQAALDQRLAQIEQELVAARKQLGTLDDYLEQVRQVLGQPETYLQIKPLSLRLNRLGVKLDANSPEPGETIRLFELTSLETQRIGVLVRVGREELPLPPQRTQGTTQAKIGTVSFR